MTYGILRDGGNLVRRQCSTCNENGLADRNGALCLNACSTQNLSKRNRTLLSKARRLLSLL